MCSALLIRLVFSFSLFFNKKSHYVFTTLLILDPSVWLRHIIRSTFRGAGTYGDMGIIVPPPIFDDFSPLNFDFTQLPIILWIDALFPSNLQNFRRPYFVTKIRAIFHVKWEMKLGIFLFFSFSLHIRTLIALTDPRLTGSQLREPSCLLCYTALHSPSLPPELCMIKIQDQRTKLTFLEANDWVCVHR